MMKQFAPPRSPPDVWTIVDPADIDLSLARVIGSPVPLPLPHRTPVARPNAELADMSDEKRFEMLCDALADIIIELAALSVDRDVRTDDAHA